MVELSNIPFSRMFTCFSYARQNVAEKMEIIAGELPSSKDNIYYIWLEIDSRDSLGKLLICRIKSINSIYSLILF